MAAYIEEMRYFKSQPAVRKMMVLRRLNDREIAERAFQVYSVVAR